MKSKAKEIIDFCKEQLSVIQPRDDYKELLQLTLLLLDRDSSHLTFYLPGAYHKARWMAIAIYSLVGL